MTLRRGAWEIMDEKDIPSDHSRIKNKWIFKIKQNGVFRARLIVCGCIQVPGIDFNESFAPVLKDVSHRIMQNLSGT